MHERRYSDAGHSGLTSEASSDTVIELVNLEDHSLEHRRPSKDEDYRDDYREPEEDYAEDDDVDNALLLPREGPPGEGRSRSPSPTIDKSTWKEALRIVIETGPTLLLTTVGLLFTGELLNSVSHWKAMTEVDELIMIIPVILNLKGNLEMNLSARLGTAANVGELDKPAVRRQLILGNLSLLQVQATVVSFIAAVVAFVLGRIIPSHPTETIGLPGSDDTPVANATLIVRSLMDRKPRPQKAPTKGPGGLNEFILTASSSMLAACLSSALLGSFMCTLVVLCRKFGLDPDNIAPPVAACLGDLVTLSLLGVVSALNILLVHTPLPLIFMIILAVAAVGWAIVTRRNQYVGALLFLGWLPLFAAMIISCGTGIVLDMFVSRYEGFAILATVISGLPGNVGAILVSRLSTALHTSDYALSRLPEVSTDSFARASPSAPPPSTRLVMLTLVLVTFPIEVAFLATLRAVGWLRVPIIFLIFSVAFFCIAVVASLFLARALTNVLWKRKLDPDMYALPIHSALVDLIGQLLLVVCFELVSRIGVPVKGGIDNLM
ncbi:magnesium transporter [Phanerochaete sordida]|uniref:Magnesium transporter n=1 Tax=Phanerochaete sordida TaxID=48140 RepID=A0A9P3LB04_9APHY|nr:magnesium transporter [Phanerochaete sordida]